MSTNQTWALLAEGQGVQRYEPGQFIYLQDTPATHFYYLIEGRVRSFIHSPDGDERVLTFHQAGDLMGEASFFDESPRVSSAIAVESCLVVAVDRSQIDRLLLAHPELALPLLQHLARTVRLVTRHVDGMSFLKADQRVARYLLTQTQTSDTITCTHQEIGFSVGLNRITVSRILSKFAKKQWIRTAYRQIKVLNPDALARIVA